MFDLLQAILQDLQLKADDRRFYAGLLQVGRPQTCRSKIH